MSRNTVSPELHRNEALTCVVRTGFCKSYTEEIWPRMHRSGARGSRAGAKRNCGGVPPLWGPRMTHSGGPRKWREGAPFSTV